MTKSIHQTKIKLSAKTRCHSPAGQGVHAVPVNAPDAWYVPAGHTTHDVLDTGKCQPDPQHNAWIHTNPSPPAEGTYKVFEPADPTPTPHT